ncbi:MAG: alpha/beta fold hydrolase [Solirubrobacterales bacterium]
MASTRASRSSSSSDRSGEEHPRRIVLDDGRLLAFAEYGDPAGRPIFSFHGGLSSRLDAAPLSAECRALGVRLISPDRPGIGRSDFQRARVLADWPRDVNAIADSLDLGRFAVMGWSLGGQYAAVCAHALPHRVTRAAMLASVVPFEIAETDAGLTWIDRSMLRLSRSAPHLASVALRAGISLPSVARLQRVIDSELSAADLEAMRRDRSPTAVAEAIKEALRSGTRGVVRDYRIYGDEWGLKLEHIRIEVGIWQGDADGLVPAADAKVLADRIPRSKLVIAAGEGHISLVRNRCAEIMRWLCADG